MIAPSSLQFWLLSLGLPTIVVAAAYLSVLRHERKQSGPGE